MSRNKNECHINVVSSTNSTFHKRLYKQRTLVYMSLPFLIYVLIFNYVPLVGWVMAFQKYKPGKGLFDQEWCDLFQFKLLFQDDTFLRVIRNTLAMSMINLFLGFVTAIGLAILLNEVKQLFSKKVIQTISYMPHFLSWIIVTGIVMDVLSPETGIVNQVLMGLHNSWYD